MSQDVTAAEIAPRGQVPYGRYSFRIDINITPDGRMETWAAEMAGMHLAASEGGSLGECLIDMGLKMVGASWLDRLARLLATPLAADLTASVDQMTTDELEELLRVVNEEITRRQEEPR